MYKPNQKIHTVNQWVRWCRVHHARWHGAAQYLSVDRPVHPLFEAGFSFPLASALRKASDQGWVVLGPSLRRQLAQDPRGLGQAIEDLAQSWRP